LSYGATIGARDLHILGAFVFIRKLPNILVDLRIDLIVGMNKAVQKWGVCGNLENGAENGCPMRLKCLILNAKQGD